MAITDTLSDAALEIRGYLANQPSMYAPVLGQIEKLLAEMDSLRTALDTPPYNDPTGPEANVSEALHAAISAPMVKK